MSKSQDSLHIPYFGHQYPEARCFDRTFVFDPETQARALHYLIGYYGLANVVKVSDPGQGKALIGAISTLTEYFVDRYPECMQEEAQIDSDCGGGVYHREERLAEFVLKIIDENKEPR